MSIDARLPSAKYPDEVWLVPIDWSACLEPGDAIVGAPTVIGVGLVATFVGITGPVMVARVTGGDLDTDELPRIECTALTAAGETLGFNLGIKIRPR